MAEATTPPNPADEGGSRPVPDPTVLTTDALRREIAGLEKLIDTKLDDAEKLVDSRLDDAEKLVNEKFRAVDHQLAEADKQRLEQKSDTAAQVKAALDAQEKAITKTESSTADQIAQLNRTVDTKVEGLERSHSDLKDRVTVMASEKTGAKEQVAETRAVTGGQLAIFGAVMVVLVLIINIVLFIIAQGGTP